MPSLKRKISYQHYENEHLHKKSKGSNLSNLDKAKQRLHTIINQQPDRRIYQIQKLDPCNPKNEYRTHVVANPFQICHQNILDEETHINVMEYYFGDERCP